MKEGNESEVSEDLCTHDRNSSGDSRDLEENAPFETVPFVKNTSSSCESRALEDLDPHISVDKLGCEMKDLFSDWSKEFLPSKDFEENTMKRLDELRKQAYILEKEFLESKLELIKKRITET